MRDTEDRVFLSLCFPSPRLMVPSVFPLVTVENIKYFIVCYYLQGDICILPMHVAYEWREILMYLEPNMWKTLKSGSLRWSGTQLSVCCMLFVGLSTHLSIHPEARISALFALSQTQTTAMAPYFLESWRQKELVARISLALPWTLIKLGSKFQADVMNAVHVA